MGFWIPFSSDSQTNRDGKILMMLIIIAMMMMMMAYCSSYGCLDY